MPSWEEMCKWETNAWSRHEAGMSELGSQGGTCPPPPTPRPQPGGRDYARHITTWPTAMQGLYETLVMEQINQEPGSKVLLRMIIFMGIKSLENKSPLMSFCPYGFGKKFLCPANSILGIKSTGSAGKWKKKYDGFKLKFESIQKTITKWR